MAYCKNAQWAVAAAHCGPHIASRPSEPLHFPRLLAHGEFALATERVQRSSGRAPGAGRPLGIAESRQAHGEQ